MKKFVIIIALLAVLGVLSYFTYPIIHDRYFSKTDESAKKISPNATVPFDQTNNPAQPASSVENPPASENSSITAPPITENVPEQSGDNNLSGSTEKQNIKANITTQHCDDDCKAFASDVVLFAYCQEVCGISPVKNDSDCDAKKDLEKDYCLKDLAITKGNADLCQSIKDTNIKKTCQKRVTEDLLEKQQSN